MLNYFPIICPVPRYIGSFNRRGKFYLLRWFARKSVKISFIKSGFSFDKLNKNNKGVPVRCGEIYWSVAHKMKYAGGIAASTPVGIDIEEILPKSEFLYDKIANFNEWKLGNEDKLKLFFRYWTAKEAVLKAECVGLIGLSSCFIEKIINENCMFVRYKTNLWNVRHFYFNGHVAALAIGEFNVNYIIN